MKFRLSQIEEGRPNPRRYAEKLVAKAAAGKKPQFNANNFRTYFRTALAEFHDDKLAIGTIVDRFAKTSRAKLSHYRFFETRLAQYVKTLRRYCEEYPTSGVTHVQMGKRFTLTVGPHEISGIIDHFGFRRPRGYRGTDIQINRKNWQRMLRWPLIQHALAEELKGSSAEIEVGVHCFETGAGEHRIFEHTEIESALAEAEEICDEIAGILAEQDDEDESEF